MSERPTLRMRCGVCGGIAGRAPLPSGEYEPCSVCEREREEAQKPQPVPREFPTDVTCPMPTQTPGSRKPKTANIEDGLTWPELVALELSRGAGQAPGDTPQ